MGRSEKILYDRLLYSYKYLCIFLKPNFFNEIFGYEIQISGLVIYTPKIWTF